jgi:hypothetical protein
MKKDTNEKKHKGKKPHIKYKFEHKLREIIRVWKNVSSVPSQYNINWLILI